MNTEGKPLTGGGRAGRRWSSFHVFFLLSGCMKINIILKSNSWIHWVKIFKVHYVLQGLIENKCVNWVGKKWKSLFKNFLECFHFPGHMQWFCHWNLKFRNLYITKCRVVLIETLDPQKSNGCTSPKMNKNVQFLALEFSLLFCIIVTVLLFWIIDLKETKLKPSVQHTYQK